MNHNLKLKKPLAVFDLETTGVNTAKDRIVELCVAKALPSGELVVKTYRVNPGVPIPLETSLIHGIYDEDVKDAPSFKSIARTLAQFLEGCDLAGFNSNRFDIPLLVEEFLRANVDFDMKNRRMVDVQRIYHLMEPRNLSAAYRHFCGKELVGAHGAEADTLATFEVLDTIVQKHAGQTIRDEGRKRDFVIDNDVEALDAIGRNNNVDLAGRMVFNEKGEEVINFGKHAGKPVLDVLKNEPSFYDWVQKGEFSLDTKRRLTEIRLRMFTGALNGTHSRGASREK
ncbi:exonuclease domain-containing protein [Fibrella sp. WM1]|uniref:3'-5' exonuclease n=1 Tax=Fibrella musci TaxID=3242485 RepID=UPI003520F6BC